MPKPTPQQNEWISRVLGVSIGSPATPGARPDLTAALDGWQDALDAVDVQIANLQRALRATDDDDLHDIAEFGLNAVTGNHKVRIQAALMQLRSNPADTKAAGVATTLLDSFLTHITTSEKVAACDDNPFGVKMSLRASLTPPLQTLQAALQNNAA